MMMKNDLRFSSGYSSASVGAGKCGGKTMRNIHLLEQFMQENGIEYDVPFTVERTGYLGERELMNVKISKSDDYTGFELSYADSTKQMGNSSAVMQELMFSDKDNFYTYHQYSKSHYQR